MTEASGEPSSTYASDEGISNKRLKIHLPEKEDRISDLPDPLIHHILSFLPCTKQAIQSGILSKRWRNQWTYVPALIFDSIGMSCENFFRSIDNTLISYNCSKIRKFHIQFHYHFELVPLLIEKIRFAIRRDVEELILNSTGFHRKYVLPEFLFDNTSLVKLETFNCIFMANEVVNWGFIKALNLEHCRVPEPVIANVVSGSPLLESLKLNYNYDSFDQLVIDSKSLKKLVLLNLDISVLEISCPQLEVLSLKKVLMGDNMLFDQAIENVLSASPVLESLELIDCDLIDHLVVESKSLKRLVLGDFKYCISIVEISCPKLDKLELFGCLDVRTYKIMNLPSRISATLDFESRMKEYDESFSNVTRESLAMDILRQLQHVSELKIGSRFIKILSGLEVGSSSCPLLDIKCLTLDDPNLNEHLPGIACALHNSPELEQLVINVPVYRFLGLRLQVTDDVQELNDNVLNYWSSNEIAFNCLVAHLKTVKIVGLPERDDKCELVLNFLEFLLRNARVLEKMIVILEDYGTSFAVRVSQKLLSFPKCSEHAIVELVCSN